jgi:1,4-alpha-glucan branching enzyme
VSLLRKNRAQDSTVVVVCNFTPVVRRNYRVGVPSGGLWIERLNSDAHDYGGSGAGNMGAVEASPLACHGRRFSLSLMLPPLSILFLANEQR